jgi:hypothetical protein
MGGFTILQESEDGLQRTVLIHPMDLIHLFESGTIVWPQIKDSDIDDRSQSDKFMKAIAIAQVVWFAAQIIGRVADGLAVTTIELFTLSNVFCTAITYLAWWHKPNGVRAPILIEGVAPQSSRSVSELSLGDPIIGPSSKWPTVAGLLIGFSFGSLHLIGWQFHFPSGIECMLWRICCVGVIVSSVILPLLALTIIENEDETGSNRLFKRVNNSRCCLAYVALPFWLNFYTPLGIYGLFRLGMLVEMFVGLRDVPVGAYETVQWTQYFPFLG